MNVVEATIDRGYDTSEIPPHSAHQWEPQRSVSQLEHLEDFRNVLARFEPISLAEMDTVALMDRTDTKYVLSVHQLCGVLASLSEDYRVLEIDGVRLNRYQTIYFDTDDFAIYSQHHAGKPDRYKVRSRIYVDTDTAFLEIKRKSKRDRTVKHRIQTAGLATQLTPGAIEFVESRIPLAAESLQPKLANTFSRITLTGKQHQERVTLDLGLQFSVDGRSVTLSGIAVAEVKQDGIDRSSPFVRRMRATAGIRPSSFSKYCMGVSMLYADVKHNRFKPGLRLIQTLKEERHAA